MRHVRLRRIRSCVTARRPTYSGRTPLVSSSAHASAQWISVAIVQSANFVAVEYQFINFQADIRKKCGRKLLDREADSIRGAGKSSVADRFSLEISFRDCKEVVGAGQQQVRFVWANVGSFHVCLWAFTMTEAWAWTRPAAELVDRSDSPWDSPLRRPSHADKRRAWRRALLGEEIRAALRPGVTDAEIQATAERLLRLAA